ncbi:NACHT domain-containing NTPase [Amycolatopsis sp. 195334CR]|uniref:NACHT domain-containing protein n=1 Tax=Amycolatopsis sp. 195334CR TaxID=2814588 RepID=UPI001A8E99E7|nr:NACHT domain-containing protein [Amycolatopsis sp. 195334CR]MBN6039067.1 NACHT domain-containing protein [Amycolatopsis sp. 195334CR]
MEGKPERRAWFVDVTMFVLTVLMAIAVNYATSGDQAPGPLALVKQRPWQFILILSVLGLLVYAWQGRWPGRPGRGVQAKHVTRACQSLANQVRADWVEKILAPSVEVELPAPVLVQRWNAVRSAYTTGAGPPGDDPVPPGVRLVDLAEQRGWRMLVLGAAGAGKTTALLTVVRDLLDRGTGPVPVVFLLSRWTRKRSLLARWLADELVSLYKLSGRDVAAHLVRERLVLPVLDGLNEVDPRYRQACIEAIEQFRDGFPDPPPVLVGARTGEHPDLPRLGLNGAVLVSPLSHEQVERYLTGSGQELAALRDAFHRSEELAELLSKPLFLHQAATVYRGAEPLPDTGWAAEHLISAYVHRMLTYQAVTDPPDPPRLDDQVLLAWLRWVAVGLVRDRQDLFRIAEVDAGALAGSSRRWWASTGLNWAIGIAGGLVIGGLFARMGWSDTAPFPWYLGYSAGAIAVASVTLFLLARESRVPDGPVLRWNWKAAFGWLLSPFAFVTVSGLVATAILLRRFVDPVIGSNTLTLVAMGSWLVLCSAGHRMTKPAEALPSELDALLRAVNRSWVLVLLSGALVHALAVAMFRATPVWPHFVVDTTLLLWVTGAALAAVVTGVVLLAAPARGQHSLAFTAAVLGAAATCLLISALDSSTWVASLHRWIFNPVLLALVVTVTAASIAVHRRWGPVAGHAAGGLVAACGSLVLIQQVDVIRFGWYGDPPLLPLTIALTSGIGLVIYGGGSAWLGRQLTRVLLVREGHPPDIDATAADACARGLLRRTAGGYLFPHDLVRLHLATGPTRQP